MSLAQIPGRSTTETGDERVRGDRALEDEIQRRGELVVFEAQVNNAETAIPHNQTTIPTVIATQVIDNIGIAFETRPPDARSIYLRTAIARTFRITLLVRRR